MKTKFQELKEKPHNINQGFLSNHINQASSVNDFLKGLMRNTISGHAPNQNDFFQAQNLQINQLNALNQQIYQLIQLQKQLLLNPLLGSINPMLLSLIYPIGIPDIVSMSQVISEPQQKVTKFISPILIQPEKKQKKVDRCKNHLQKLTILDGKKVNDKQQTAQVQVHAVHLKLRSCFHINIAYTIQFNNYKEKGKTSIIQPSDYLLIDPTYLASKLRQKNPNIRHVNL